MTEQEDDPTSRLQDQRVHRLSVPWCRPDRRHRGAGGRRRQARTVRHQFRQGQDDVAGSDRENRLRRHAQAGRRAAGQARAGTLKGRARVKRTMWSRRAQEYEAKINSGDIVAIAEVVRDLFRSDTQPEQSYSERQLYEAALDRLSREISAVQRITETEAIKEIEAALAKGPRRGPKPAEGEGEPMTKKQSWRKRRHKRQPLPEANSKSPANAGLFCCPAGRRQRCELMLAGGDNPHAEQRKRPKKCPSAAIITLGLETR